MLNKTGFTKSAFDQIDELQRRYARLKTEQKLNRVDVYDAEHGGGFGELSQAMAEQEEIEDALDAVECFLHQEGVTPMEEIPFSNCETPEEEQKLQRYYEIFYPCEGKELPVLGD